VRARICPVIMPCAGKQWSALRHSLQHVAWANIVLYSVRMRGRRHCEWHAAATSPSQPSSRNTAAHPVSEPAALRCAD